VESKLRNDLAAKRQEYQQKAQAESLAAEFGITYDKACELLLHYDHEQEIRYAEKVLGLKRQRIKYLKRDALDGLLSEGRIIKKRSEGGVNPFELEDLCDADD
jgi:hypothetical protein